MKRAQRINVLVVDDDPGDLAVVAEALASPNCNVVTAPSGTEALRHILKTDFALILLDVTLPGMDGVEVATVMRQVKRCAHIPIIFMTPPDSKAQPDFCDGTGLLAGIPKPVDPAVLQSMVAGVASACGRSGRAEVGRVGEDLELLIRERTASLIRANDDLRAEVARRERAEEALHAARLEAEAANSAKSEFLANMSHEIRTPMNGILGLLELVLQTRLTPEQREYLNLMKVSAGSLLAIINDILDFSKIEAGSLELERIPFSLRETVGDTLKALAFEAGRKGLELAFDIEPALPDALLGDPVRLRQIVTNLVGNAIKFTANGEVVLRASLRGRGDGEVACDFSIRDTGVGIPPEKIKTIFAPFFQGDTSTTRLYGGTGLGLTIAARLVEIMGGTIGVESELDNGSNFHFQLRFALQAAPAGEAERADFSGMRVLLAAHPANRAALGAMLRHWSAEVEEAADGVGVAGGISAAAAAGRPFTLVLLDESLPGTDAYELAARIRRGAFPGAAAAAVLGSIARRQAHAERLEGAGFPVLTKPFKPSEVLALLKTVVGAASITAPVPPTPVRKTGPALDVLLVEDNAINARLAQQVLVKAGHRVVTVDSGLAAMSALERGGCDLVLMDIQMPGMDGLEATRLIRRNEQLTGDHLPIIALTAHAMEQHRERCLRAGMDAFLVKPIQAQELLDAIERLGCTPRSAFAPRRKAVVDRAVLLERIDDDSDLLEEVTDMLRDKGARALAEARSALAARNADQCALLLHTLSGMLRSLAADAALELVDRLEIIVAEGNWEVMENGFVRLEAEIERLAAELGAMTRERRARSKLLLLDAGDVAMPRGASGLA